MEERIEKSKTDMDITTMQNLRETINVLNNEREDKPIESTLRDKELNNFWGMRARDSSIWSLFVNTGNIINNIAPLISPVSEEQRIAYIYYFIASILVYVSLFLFY